MNLDLDLYIGNYQGNFTYNLTKVWYKIYPNDKHFVDIDGMTGRQAMSKLDIAINMIAFYYYDYLKLNLEDGKGSLDDFYHWLCELLLQCARYPDEVWSSCR